MQKFGAPDPRGRYAKIRADTRADTTEFSWQAQKRGRYDGRYARYRDFRHLALSGEYLRVCSCIFHCIAATSMAVFFTARVSFKLIIVLLVLLVSTSHFALYYRQTNPSP